MILQAVPFCSYVQNVCAAHCSAISAFSSIVRGKKRRYKLVSFLKTYAQDDKIKWESFFGREITARGDRGVIVAAESSFYKAHFLFLDALHSFSMLQSLIGNLFKPQIPPTGVSSGSRSSPPTRRAHALPWISFGLVMFFTPFEMDVFSLTTQMLPAGSDRL